MVSALYGVCWTSARNNERTLSMCVQCMHVYDRNLSVALVVDLSKPEELWLTVDRWLDVVKARVTTVVRDAQSTDLSLKDKLQQTAWQRVGEQHEVSK